MSDLHNHPLATAFAMQSINAARSEAMALKAEAEGEPELARGLRAVAASRSVQARRLLMLLRGKIPTTVDEVWQSHQEETRLAAELLARMAAEAERRGEDRDQRVFTQALAVESSQRENLDREAMGGGLFVCQVCGHLALGRAPENCPVCGAVPSKFLPV